MSSAIGIDLNGLCDVSVDANHEGVLRGGDFPSVVVVQPRQGGGSVRVVAGTEAGMAVEGRGWHWPDSARLSGQDRGLRVPLTHIFEALGTDRLIQAGDDELEPIELLAAAISALGHPKDPATRQLEAPTVVLSVPDDGRFLEEQRQLLINAAERGGLIPTLLWRPVAALLGLEPDLARTTAQLAGKSMGIVSCLEDGVYAACVETEVTTDRDGQEYFVPLRRKPGIMVPYQQRIGTLAAELARAYAPEDDPQAGWQLLWGSGLVLAWLLHQEVKDAVVQTRNGWRLIPGQKPSEVPELTFEEAELDRLGNFLEGVDYTVFEGPALEANAGGSRLHYYLRDRVARSAHSLNFAGKSAHLVAWGCARYQRRRAQGRITYYDHLPQLRLVVRRGEDPVFLELVDPAARVEGGEVYEAEQDLGLSVNPGTAALSFYLLREGNAKPRHVQIGLPEKPTSVVPVRLRIRQQPAQGTARLTLIAAADESGFRPIELHWHHMTEEDLTEEEVLAQLREEPTEVPPTQSQPCHTLLWTEELADGIGSLLGMLPSLESQFLYQDPPVQEVRRFLNIHSKLLTRRAAPIVLTRQRVRDWTLYRAVSSDGDLPEPDGDLSSEVLRRFDYCLRRLDELTTSMGASRPTLRTAAVRMGGWCFLRCPPGVRKHLLDTARHGQIPDTSVYFRAMGKVFAENEEFQAFFSLLERRLGGHNATFKLYEIEGLFYMMSLREKAPHALSFEQATLLARKLLDRIDERVRAHAQLSRLVNVSLKAYAGLMRYRLVRADFMTSEDPILGKKQQRVLESLLQRCRRDNRLQMVRLTASIIEWSELRGSDRKILQWDEEGV